MGVISITNILIELGYKNIFLANIAEGIEVRKKFKSLLIITPGIRLPGDNSDDQARVMTPKDAFKNKVSGVVMGRSLTKGNIKHNVKKLIDHLSQ